MISQISQILDVKSGVLKNVFFISCFFLSITFFAQEPSVPINLTVIQGTPNEFTVTWDPPITGTPTLYNVFIQQLGGAFTYVASTADASIRTYTFTGSPGGVAILDGNTYTATIQSIPDGDNNAYQNTGEFVLNPVQPSSPLNLKVSDGVNPNEFTVTWDPPATGTPTLYNVFIQPLGGAFTYVATTADASIRNYTFTGSPGGVAILDGNTYTATIQSIPDGDNNAYSAPSSPITVNTFSWTGTNSNDWNVTTNWDRGEIPSAISLISIPSGVINYPTVSSAVSFNSLIINSGTSFISQSTVTGSVTYKRNLPTTNWYLIGVPVDGETKEDIIANHNFAVGTGGNIGIGEYNNNGSIPWGFSNSTSSGSIEPGRGISMKLTSPGDISISGTVNTSNVSVDISRGTRNDFSLLGNPFTAYINSSTFASNNTSNLEEETVWLWDGTQYVTYNQVSPIQIAPAQGFFVKAKETLVGNGTVTFATSNQSHQNTDTFMRQIAKPSFELFIKDGAQEKSTKVFYVNNKTIGLDNGYDSSLFNDFENGFEIFTALISNNKGEKLAIQTLPNQNYDKMIIPIGLIAEAGKKVVFSVSTQNLPSNIKMYLEDRVNNKFTDLSRENYAVILKNKKEGIGQFYIHTSSKNLNKEKVVKSIEGISLYKSQNREITIAGLQGEGKMKVHSILGEELANKELRSNGISKIKLPRLSAGIYIITLNSELGSISEKIILK